MLGQQEMQMSCASCTFLSQPKQKFWCLSLTVGKGTHSQHRDSFLIFLTDVKVRLNHVYYIASTIVGSPPKSMTTVCRCK